MTNNKELFLTWTKNLFYLHCAALVGYIIGLLPFIGSWFGWVNTIVAIGTVFCLYKLAPVSERYRKAAIFSGLGVGLTIIINLVTILSILSIVASIFQLIGLYQEFCGHSEMLNGIDEKLSRKWHGLFNWNIFGSIVLGILGAPLIVMLGAMLLLDANVLTAITLVLIGGFDIIIRIVYLLYLKHTREAYQNYEPQMEYKIPEGEI